MLNDLFNFTNLIAVSGAIAAWVITVFIGMMMERYKNRRLELTNSITFQKIGLPADSFLPGVLEVNYNGDSVNSLHLFRLSLKNNSNFDSKELPVNFFTDLDSYILSHSYSWIPSTTTIGTWDNYNHRIGDYNAGVYPILKEDPHAAIPEPLLSEGRWLYRNRQLIASSLNRKEEIEITVLIGSQTHGHQPKLFLQIPAAGVLLTNAIDPLKENERIAKICFGIGIFLTIALGTYYIFPYRDESPSFIFISLLGAFNFFIGYAIYGMIKFVHSYFK